MHSYPRIIARLQTETWAITSMAYMALWAALESHMESGSALPQLALTENKPRFGAPQTSSGKGVGVVDMSGVIAKKLSMMESMCGGVNLDSFVEGVQAFADDKTIGTIIMNFDSPGGTITGVPEAYDALKAIGEKKTLLSYTEAQQCSAAEWLASAASSKYAAGSATVGSIGVYNMSLDRTEQFKKMGVKPVAISAGKHKLMGAPFQPLTDEQRAMLQERVDNTHADFKRVVTLGRNVDPSVLEGQPISGHEGLKAGLIDGIYPNINALIKAILDTNA